MTGNGDLEVREPVGSVDQQRRRPGNLPGLPAADDAGATARSTGNVLVAGGVDSGVFLSLDGGDELEPRDRPAHAGGSAATAHLPRPRFAYFDNEPAGTTSGLHRHPGARRAAASRSRLPTAERRRPVQRRSRAPT